MKFSRLTLAGTLSAALVLSSCTGSDDPDGGTTSPTQTQPTGAGAEDTDATSAPGDDTSATSAGDGTSSTEAAGDDDSQTAAGDDTSQTTGPGDEAATTEMTTDPEAADLTVADAEEIARTVLGVRLDTLKTSKDKNFRAAREAALLGSAATAATGEYKLRRVVGAPSEAGLDEAAEPNVLAISRADDQDAQLLLVQTVPDEDGIPVLHLMESATGEPEDFRITWEAPMLPGTSVPTFDKRSVGTPTLGPTEQGDLPQSPRELLKAVAAWISWPVPSDDANPGVRTHGYVPAVRDAAEAQAAAVSEQATLQEKNWLVSDDVRTLFFEDGTALVLGTYLRDTQFDVRSGSVLTPPETFSVFADDASLEDEAVLRTMVFVALHVPSKDVDFQPEMIAAREQLVDAWGA